MKAVALALAAGSLFGAGLELAGMTDPAKVQNFLDLLGTWDPSLAFVMGSALAVSTAGVWRARARPRPWLTGRFSWPTRTDVDPSLVLGALLFGVGWGLAGLCPGPALANLHRLDPGLWLFAGAMLLGVWIHRTWSAARAPVEARGQA